MAATKLLLDVLGVKSEAELFTTKGQEKLRKLESQEDEWVTRCNTCCGVREMSELPSADSKKFTKAVAFCVSQLLLEPDPEDRFSRDDPGLRCLTYYDVRQETLDKLLELGFVKFAEFYNPNSKNWVFGVHIVFTNPDDPVKEGDFIPHDEEEFAD